MPRSYLTFGDLDGKLDMLRVECGKCERKGRYSVAKLIERYGRRANLTKWLSNVRGDYPKARDTCSGRTLRRALPGLGKGAVGARWENRVTPTWMLPDRRASGRTNVRRRSGERNLGAGA